MGLEALVPEGILTTRLESVVNWSRQNSTWPLLFGLACCAIEMIATGTARHDIARYGSELFRASPRQADLMIVSGRCPIPSGLSQWVSVPAQVGHLIIMPLCKVWTRLFLWMSMSLAVRLDQNHCSTRWINCARSRVSKLLLSIMRITIAL